MKADQDKKGRTVRERKKEEGERRRDDGVCCCRLFLTALLSKCVPAEHVQWPEQV